MFITLSYRAQPSEAFEICRLQVCSGSGADVAHSRLYCRELQQRDPCRESSVGKEKEPEKADARSQVVRVIDWRFPNAYLATTLQRFLPKTLFVPICRYIFTNTSSWRLHSVLSFAEDPSLL